METYTSRSYIPGSGDASYGEHEPATLKQKNKDDMIVVISEVKPSHELMDCLKNLYKKVEWKCTGNPK